MSLKKDLATLEGHIEPLNHTADGISYDPTSSGLISTEVQGAIDELAAVSGSGPSMGFVGHKEITSAVTIPSKCYMIATGLVIMNTGSIQIGSDSELFLI